RKRSPGLAERRPLSPRPIHDHCDSHETQGAADHVEAIGGLPIHEPAPQQGEDHEYAPISGVDPAKMGGLKGGDDAIQEKDEPAQNSDEQSPAVTQPLPDEI